MAGRGAGTLQTTPNTNRVGPVFLAGLPRLDAIRSTGNGFTCGDRAASDGPGRAASGAILGVSGTASSLFRRETGRSEVLLQELPVPPLNHTLDRYLQVVRPLLTDEEWRETAGAVNTFRDTCGPHLQDELILCGDMNHRRGGSWLSDLWFDTYMKVRDPLQLSTNVAFQLEWPTDRKGVLGAAHFTALLASVYSQFLRGEMRPEYSSRGVRLTESQRRFLKGGLRVPRPKKDKFEDGNAKCAGREIIVLRNGSAFAVQVLASDGKPLAEDHLAEAFNQVLAQAPDRGTFTFLSHLGAKDAAKVRTSLMKDPLNVSVERQLRDALFVLDLADEPTAGGVGQALEQLGFGVGSACALKPASYQFGLVDGFVGVNLEHSTLDGATLKSVVVQAQEAQPDWSTESSKAPALLTWNMTKKQKKHVETLVKKFKGLGAGLEVDVVFAPFDPQTDGRYSADAAMQWVILYASLATWGQVPSTYEAVDMREYRAGRTESFRPTTKPAVRFVQALLDGDATEDMFAKAASAHSLEVKNAKLGMGIERHLYGLAEMAEAIGEKPALFSDAGYRALTENFLSTTSLGGPVGVTRMAFAPVTPGGLGINYTRVEGGFEYCVTSDPHKMGDDGRTQVQTFENQLIEGAHALSDFLSETN